MYLDAPERVVLRVPGQGSLVVRKTVGFRDLVLWNLGEAKAPGMKDLGTGEWKRYVCLEAAAVGKPIQLAAGACFEASQAFEINE